MTTIILALIIVASFSFGFCVACWLAAARRYDGSARFWTVQTIDPRSGKVVEEHVYPRSDN